MRSVRVPLLATLCLLPTIHHLFATPAPAPPVSSKDPVFEHLLGTWDLSYTVRTSADATPSVDRGVERHRLAAGGLFKVVEFEGEMFGEAYDSIGIMSRDPNSDEYTTWYFDNSNSQAQVSKGTWDASTRQMIKWSDGADFDGTPGRWKQVLDLSKPERYRLTMLAVRADGDEREAIVCDAVRKPKSRAGEKDR